MPSGASYVAPAISTTWPPSLIIVGQRHSPTGPRVQRPGFIRKGQSVSCYVGAREEKLAVRQERSTACHEVEPERASAEERSFPEARSPDRHMLFNGSARNSRQTDAGDPELQRTATDVVERRRPSAQPSLGITTGQASSKKNLLPRPTWDPLSAVPPADPKAIYSALGEEVASAWRSARMGKWQPGNCTPYPYLEASLREADSARFAAAGILALRGKYAGAEVLLGRQQVKTPLDRTGNTLNILGGKREPQDKSAEQTAIREADEETGSLIRAGPLLYQGFGETRVLWYPQGKYAVFLRQCFGRKSLPDKYRTLAAQAGINETALEITELEWIPVSDILAGTLDPVLHPFMKGLVKCAPLNKYLMDLLT
eukprot:jgi/Mesvir1/6521/Mv16786-RA.1